MTDTTRPLRSVLYIPGGRLRALDKARQLPVDAIIFDLEDAVAPDEKDAARNTLAEALDHGGFGHRLKIVRVNGLETPWGTKDVEMAAGANADAILVPKVNGPADLDAVAAKAGTRPLWAMMETPLSMLRAEEIAAHPRLAGMVMGTNDLARELKCQPHPERLPMITGLSLCLLAAKAHGKAIVDGVFNAFRDDDGLRAEALQGRQMGFDGKTLIHPAQVDIANDIFSPQPDEIDLAERQIAAFDAAMAKGEAVAVVDGRIVENLHVAMARETLAQRDMIAALNAE